MGIAVDLYIINENKFPTSLTGSDEEKWNALAKTVQDQGARWESFEGNQVEFMIALEAVDYMIGGTKILPVFTYNHSPHDLLGTKPNCESFGYFTPKQVKDIYECLNDIIDLELDASIRNELLGKFPKTSMDAIEEVLYKYFSTFRDAANKSYAVAVIHI